MSGATFTRNTFGSYVPSNMVPLQIRREGSSWILETTGRADLRHGRHYNVSFFRTLADAKSFALPMINHPQGCAAAEGWARLASRKLEGFGGHERARRFGERMASYLDAWRTRRIVSTGAMVRMYGSETPEHVAAYDLMPARDGGDGFPYFVEAQTDADIEEAARELGIDLEPNTSREFRTALVTATAETRAPNLGNERRWVIRAFHADGSASLYPALQIKREARADAAQIAAGRNVVAAIVMDGFEEVDDIPVRDWFVTDTHAFGRIRHALNALGSFIEGARIAALLEDAASEGLAITRRHSGTEDGALWYVIDRRASSADHLGGLTLDGGFPDKLSAAMTAAYMAAEVSAVCDMIEARIHPDACEGITVRRALEVFEHAASFAQDCQWGDMDADDIRELDPLTLLQNAARHYDGGFTGIYRDSVASSWAVSAAVSFEYDDDAEGADDAAQRAVDILRDLPDAAVPAFLARIFGVPSEDRTAADELHRIRLECASGTEHVASDFAELRAQARAEVGIPDVARMLVYFHATDLELRAFAGHALPDGRTSTNLAAWREARAAFDAVNALASHTFGGMCLDGHRWDVDKLAAVTLDAAAEAVRYAVANAMADDSEDAIEVGMPRAE